jgi:hypothetical protein
MNCYRRLNLWWCLPLLIIKYVLAYVLILIIRNANLPYRKFWHEAKLTGTASLLFTYMLEYIPSWITESTIYIYTQVRLLLGQGTNFFIAKDHTDQLNEIYQSP